MQSANQRHIANWQRENEPQTCIEKYENEMNTLTARERERETISMHEIKIERENAPNFLLHPFDNKRVAKLKWWRKRKKKQSNKNLNHIGIYDHLFNYVCTVRSRIRENISNVFAEKVRLNEIAIRFDGWAFFLHRNILRIVWFLYLLLPSSLSSSSFRLWIAVNSC